MPGTSPALQIAAENFPLGGVAPSESGELSKDGHRPSTVKLLLTFERKALIKLTEFRVVWKSTNF